jgi:hypothetical protein
VKIPLLKDSRLGERAIDSGKLFQTDIVLGPLSLVLYLEEEEEEEVYN